MHRATFASVLWYLIPLIPSVLSYFTPLILQECFDSLKEDSKAYKRYVKRRDSLAN